jgi:NAD(P)-dependent dehydrogenase (short-subunit alcohol dehydrogenase family)
MADWTPGTPRRFPPAPVEFRRPPPSRQDAGMEQLDGKVAVVTGAASGIGRAVATALAAEGMRVALADIEADALDRTVAELSDAGHDVIGVPTDVSSGPAIEALADATLQRFGTVHVVHNNAGVVAGGLVEDLSLQTWEWVLGVDLWSVIHGVRTFLPILKANDDGHIVNTASTAGIQAAAGIAPYNVAKFGVVALSETVRVELERAGSAVGCSVLCPGAVNTQIVFADRNRPGGRLEGDEVHASFQARAGKNLAEHGKDPAEVAAMVIDAIRTNRFWIVTHPGWFEVMAARAAAMPDGQLVQGRGDDAAASPASR